MADFDPAQRQETWLFMKGGPARNPSYHRLRYNIVHYDGSPDGLIEPAALSDFYTDIHVDPAPVAVPSSVSGLGRFDRMEIFEFPPFDGVHGFD